MLRIWEFIVHGCWHQWRGAEKCRLVKNAQDNIGHGVRYYYQCEKCHRIKKIDIS